jgi:hypothetical protein
LDLINAYALHSGLKIDKPIITEEFFPLTYDNYITVHTGGGDGKFDSKLYDYWNEVMFLIKPFLSEYKIVQVGGKDDRPMQGTDIILNGQTNIKQLIYIVKRARMHFGNDSFPIHVASALNTPVVSIYGPTTVANHGPHWHHKDSVFLESHRNGAKANYARQESPKTVDMIYPEVIANAILKVLDKDQISDKTVFMGPQYSNNIIEIIPNILINPQNLQGKNPNIRLDYHFDEDITFKTLSAVKSAIITNQPLNLNVLKQLRKNISVFAFEVKEDTDFDYLLKLKHASLPLNLFSKERDKRKLSDLRANFFDAGTIDFLDENPNPIDNFDESSNLNFKSSKIVTGRGKIYHSLAHYNAEDESDKIINNEDFWKDKGFFWIYNKNG